MKRYFSIFASVLFFSFVCHAQLKVKPNGSLELGSISGSLNFSFMENNELEGYTRLGWNSMTVSNGVDALESGSHLAIIHGGVINMRAGNTFFAPMGATVNITEGMIH